MYGFGGPELRRGRTPVKAYNFNPLTGKTMAQRRMLSRRISHSKKLNSLSIKAQVVWMWTIPYLDDFGCYTGDPEDIKSEVFPKNRKISQADIEKALAESAAAELIMWYTANDGQPCQQYCNFDDFQTFKTDRRRISEYPPYQPENGVLVPLGNQRIPVGSLTKAKVSEVNLTKAKVSEEISINPKKLSGRLALEWCDKWDRKLKALFGPLLPKERKTFFNIRTHLLKQDAEITEQSLTWMMDAKNWADDNGHDNIVAKKCFVKKCKEKSGFKKKEE